MYFRSVKGDEAADAFEELTYAAQWKVVMVKVLGYKQVGDKTIPCAQIIDTNGPAVRTFLILLRYTICQILVFIIKIFYIFSKYIFLIQVLYLYFKTNKHP